MKSPELNPHQSEGQPERPETHAQAESGTTSRRDFLKKGLAFLATAAVAPKEAFGQAAEQREEKPVMEMVLEGQRMVLRSKDIDRLQRSRIRWQEEITDDVEQNFDAEMQEAILRSPLGRKLRQGLLKAQELGFEISSSDTCHAHLIVDRTYRLAMEEKYPDTSQQAPSKQEMIALINEVKAIIFHCAELPTREQILDKKFLRETYPNRSICVDESNTAFVLKHTRDAPLEEGRLFDFGARVEDYNKLKATNCADLAVRSAGPGSHAFGTDITFLPNKNGGVVLDQKLPTIKIIFPLYPKPKSNK